METLLADLPNKYVVVKGTGKMERVLHGLNVCVPP